MNRKKAILAIFMMAFLIIIGFVFPSIWKSQKGNKESETENTQHDDREHAETEQADTNESITFQDFEALEDFFLQGTGETFSGRTDFISYKRKADVSNFHPFPC